MKDIALPNGYKVTSWYDRSERSWVSQLLDADGNQIGEAEFDGHRDGLPYSRETLTDRAKALTALPAPRGEKMNRIAKGSGVYECGYCGKKTRRTNQDAANVRLCAACYIEAMEENERADSGAEA